MKALAPYQGTRYPDRQKMRRSAMSTVNAVTGVLLGWVGCRNCSKKNYLPYLFHVGVILQHTYVATFLSLHIWTELLPVIFLAG